jgi:hypothetical protein
VALGATLVAARSLLRLNRAGQLLDRAEARLAHQERLDRQVFQLRLQGDEDAAREVEAVLDALQAEQDATLHVAETLLRPAL